MTAELTSVVVAGSKVTTDTATADNIMVIANGNILTMNPRQPTASAMAIKNGKILAVGDLATVKKAAGSSYEYYEEKRGPSIQELDDIVNDECRKSQIQIHSH